MNYQPQLKNQGKQLKVNKSTNYLIPPYRKPTPKEQQRYEQSKQFSILPILQQTPRQLPQQQTGKQHLVSGLNPIDNDLLKKIKKLYKDDPEGYESDYNLMKERGESPQEWYDQMFDQVSKPSPRTISSTKSKPTTTQQPTTTPKRSKLELKKQKQEMLDWLNNVRIG